MIGVMAGELEGEVRSQVQISDFGSWMASEQRRIFLLCRRLLQDPDEADSATQDVFLKAYRALAKSHMDSGHLDSPGKWLTRIAVNTCLDRLRSKAWQIWRRRPPAADEEFILQMTPELAPDAESRVFARQIQHRLEAALAKLSQRQRVVFSLRHYESMALDDIAAMLKLDLGTVKAHLSRALVKLRTELRDLYSARM
jgi:RNA polymerase sigma-70 factor, ECF subfamily